MRGQSSTEYVLSIIGLMLILVALYEVSSSMNARLLALSSQIEGERAAAQLGRSLDALDSMGPSSHTVVRLYTFPQQSLTLGGALIISRSSDNLTASFLEHLSNVSSTSLVGQQTADVTCNSSGMFVTGRGA
ncbi:Uncharacterised protein [uncultured archaeon]|nr:Uncharacterised protein [uncultured archaeon]